MPDCICKLTKHCPVHFKVYKLRYPEGTYAKGGFGDACATFTRALDYDDWVKHRGSKTGKTWSQRGHLKCAFSYGNAERVKRIATAEGWVVLEISPAGIRELTIDEFFALK